ncbi:hypothetical protein [Mycolicibacterium vinylchloridicum]|uniref:hypothetical protein n=1 Tax=Mycolicibacterium vinylchloridicum TaxID=2736928 RepID=UPI0015CEA46F|nr:hypothetical protein [Mycolicibacterium vinylchloridicum]
MVAITVGPIAAAASVLVAANAGVADVLRAACATDSRRAAARATVVDWVEGSGDPELFDGPVVAVAGLNFVVAETIWETFAAPRTFDDDKLLADVFGCTGWVAVVLPDGAPE